MIEVESDATFQQRLAGHVETGEDSVSDPAIGSVQIGRGGHRLVRSADDRLRVIVRARCAPLSDGSS